MKKSDWRTAWIKALRNMPAMAICRHPDFPKYTSRVTYRRGSATALRMCMGYQVYSATGRSNAVAANYNAIQRGAKPRGAAKQTMLRALAGPHGATVARARLIQLGQADRFKHWPTGG